MYIVQDAWREFATHEKGLVHLVQNFWYSEMEFVQCQRDWERRCRDRMHGRYDQLLTASDDADGSCEANVEDDSPEPTRTDALHEATDSEMAGTSTTPWSANLGSDYQFLLV